MGPQKSRELYRVGAYGSNQLGCKAEEGKGGPIFGRFGYGLMTLLAEASLSNTLPSPAILRPGNPLACSGG